MPAGRCIVLNQSYEFLSITDSAWAAVRLLLKGRVNPLVNYDQPLRSAYMEHPVPAVAVLKHYAHVGRRRQSFALPSHRNVWIREEGKCAYCGHKISLRQTTRDHVIPRSKGGPDTILNVVAACLSCNGIKADRSLHECGLKLREGVELRQLTEEEKLTSLIKFHQAHERQTWLSFMKKSGLTLF